MFVEHQPTSAAKISRTPMLHKSITALLLPYGNYGFYSISTNAGRIITQGNTKLTMLYAGVWNKEMRNNFLLSSNALNKS
jgi:hypothetical protein